MVDKSNEELTGEIRRLEQRVAELTAAAAGHKRVEDALRLSENMLRESQEIAGLGSYVTDFVAGFWESSEVLDTLFGIDEAYKRSVEGWAALVHPEDRAMMKDYLINHVLKGEPFDKEYRIVRNNDHATRWVHGLGKLEFDAAGRVIIMHGTIQDITERKHADDLLRESEEKFRKAFATSPDAIMINRLEDGVWTSINDSFIRLMGYTEEECLGKSTLDLNIWFDEEDRNIFRRTLAACGFIRNHQVRFRSKNGEIHTGLVSGSLIELNGVQHILSVTKDITDRILLEEKINRSQRLDSLGVLAGGIAHDFNNILTGILGNISLLRFSNNAADDNHRILEDAEIAALRAKSLALQILTFAKGGVPVKKITGLQGILREAVAFAMRGSNAVCEYHIAPQLLPVDIDPVQIGQVIGNIVINAVQAMPDGGEITVTAENINLSEPSTVPLKAGPYVRFVVKDTGMGIAPDILEKIFDPYFTTKANGNGIGLAAAYSIIKNHDGYITVESEPGRGASFTTYLPASSGRVVATAPSRPAEVTKASGRILILDDEEIVRVFGNRVLKRLGYTVETFTESDKAMDRYRQTWGTPEAFDIVILDITIPGYAGGKEVLTALKKINPGIKAVVSSGYSADPVIARFKEYGFSAALPKPYGIEEASEVINNLLRPSSVRTSDDA
jgi:two-component system cell cycle sensor histidine kinase/response regulator CckA